MKICITSCTTPSLSSSSLILLARAAVTLVGTTIKLIIVSVTIIITTIKHYLEGTTIKLMPAVWESTSLWQAITDSHMSSSLGFALSFLPSRGSLPKFSFEASAILSDWPDLTSSGLKPLSRHLLNLELWN